MKHLTDEAAQQVLDAAITARGEMSDHWIEHPAVKSNDAAIAIMQAAIDAQPPSGRLGDQVKDVEPNSAALRCRKCGDQYSIAFNYAGTETVTKPTRADAPEPSGEREALIELQRECVSELRATGRLIDDEGEVTNQLERTADMLAADAPEQLLQGIAEFGELQNQLPQARELSDAASDVLSERQRQVSVEGWTPEHDDEHNHCELGRAAACYAVGSTWGGHWPDGWDFKDAGGPQMGPGHRRNLVKAAALLVAEIERLDRAVLAARSEK